MKKLMTKHFSKWASKQNISDSELIAFKELSKILLALSINEIEVATKNGDFIEVKL